MYISCLIGFIIIFLYCVINIIKNREVPNLLIMWFPYIIYTLITDDGSKNMFFGEIVMLSDTACICLI